MKDLFSLVVKFIFFVFWRALIQNVLSKRKMGILQHQLYILHTKTESNKKVRPKKYTLFQISLKCEEANTRSVSNFAFLCSDYVLCFASVPSSKGGHVGLFLWHRLSVIG